MNKACVILGAGASHDVAGYASGIKSAAWQPPLARQLFDFKNKAQYRQVINQYPGADFLAQNIASKIDQTGFDLEAELRRLAEHTDAVTNQQFKEIPPYIRDVIQKTTVDYVARPGSYDQLVFKLLAEVPHDVLFLTLNYDTYLETSLEARGYTFNIMADYVEPARTAKVVKFHGSTSWFKKLKGLGPKFEGRTGGVGTGEFDWITLLADYDVLTTPSDGNLLVLNGVSSPLSYVFEGYAIYPHLTAPLAGKDVSDAVCPEQHKRAAADFLRDCRKFLIIGTSGQDTDLLEFLDENIPNNARTLVHVVDPGPNNAVLPRFKRGVSAFAPNRPGLEKVVTEGFQSFVSGNNIDDFLNLALG